jgi:fused signal recognition particle receptor
MKSPVPFLKPKSYYSSPIKSPVTRDEIIVQRNPIQPVVEDIVVPEEPVIVEPAIVDKPLVEIEQPLEEPVIEQPKSKKSKHNKSPKPEL